MFGNLGDFWQLHAKYRSQARAPAVHDSISGEADHAPSRAASGADCSDSREKPAAVWSGATKIKETSSNNVSSGYFVVVAVYKVSNYALPALNPACSICSRAASAVECTPCTLSLKSSGLLAFSSAVS